MIPPSLFSGWSMVIFFSILCANPDSSVNSFLLRVSKTSDSGVVYSNLEGFNLSLSCVNKEVLFKEFVNLLTKSSKLGTLRLDSMQRDRACILEGILIVGGMLDDVVCKLLMNMT